MRGLDETDRQILTLLLEDGRRPFSDIAEAVGLSAPAVSDRVDRLQEIGLLQRFTVDLDRSMLQEGVPLLLDLRARPGRAADLGDALRATEGVEHVFTTADERVVATATVPDGDVESLLSGAIDLDAVARYEVDLLTDRDWRPGIGDAELAPECAECGNTVTAEGETAQLDGDVYHFCCGSCESQFVEQYEQLREGIDS
jgi:DNA-binding Lrp family transcriptional regulator